MGSSSLGNQAEVYAELLRTRAESADIEQRMLEAGIVFAGNLHNVDTLGHTLVNKAEEPGDMAWVITCATMVFLMQLGFAQLEAGMCRPKNVITTYVKNVTDFIVGAMAALLMGFAIAYGQIPLLENIEAWKFFFHLVFQATASTIVSGSMAERINFRGYMILTSFLAAFVYSSSVALTWGGGWLSQLDPPYHDFAGSGVVHLLGGSAALAGTIVLGSRLDRWEKPQLFVCHSIPQVLSGVLLLWVGWYGFNPGSTGAMTSHEDAFAASNAAMTTTISPAAAGTFVLIYDLYKGDHIDVLKFCNCALGGLVAITAGCDVLSPWVSVLIGVVACFFYTEASDRIKKHKIDDVVDAAAVHASCGVWGCIAVGLFHPDTGFLFTGNPMQLLVQIFVIIILGSLGFFPIYTVCLLLNRFGILRTSEYEERMGIDRYLFNVQAYIAMEDPDVPESVDAFKKLMAKKNNELDPGSAPLLPHPTLHTNQLLAELDIGTKLHQELKLPNDSSLATVIATAASSRRPSDPSSKIVSARRVVTPASVAETTSADGDANLDAPESPRGEMLMPSVVGAAQESLKGEDGLRAQRLVIGGEPISALLVADGHAGPEVAAVVIETLLTAFLEHVVDDPSALGLSLAAERAFLQLHKNVRSRKSEMKNAGSAVSLVLINESRCEITSCNVGDSFAILFTANPDNPKGEPVVTELTSNPRLRDNANERKRVMKEGGHLGYIMHNGAPAGPLRGYPGGVMCASAVGDGEVFFISAKPFCNTFDFPKSGGVVLVASDGVWDALSFGEAAAVALGAADPSKAAKAVVKRSIAAKGLHDDITCLCAVTGVIPGMENSMAGDGDGQSHGMQGGPDGGERGGTPLTPSGGKSVERWQAAAHKTMFKSSFRKPKETNKLDLNRKKSLLNTLNNVSPDTSRTPKSNAHDDNGAGGSPGHSTPSPSSKKNGHKLSHDISGSSKASDIADEPEHCISPAGKRPKPPPARRNSFLDPDL